MAIFRTGLFLILCAIHFSGSASDDREPSLEKVGAPARSGVRQPMAPSKLLEWLPDCPEEWELLRSEGQTLFQGHLESHALRQYRVFRAPEEERKKTDLMLVAIRDTCGRGPLLEPFQREAVPLVGGDLRLGKWGEYPLVLVRTGKETQSLRLLVAGRFIVELAYASGNNNARAIRPWLSGCNFAAMRSAKQETRPPILNRVLLEFIDEKNPKRNRRYSVVAQPETGDSAGPSDPAEKSDEKTESDQPESSPESHPASETAE